MKKSFLRKLLHAQDKPFTKFCTIVLICIIFANITGCFSKSIPDDIKSMRNLFTKEKYIIHACGEVTDSDGNVYDYTNSKEALENALKNGNKLIEVDFHYTSDNVLVCGHAWGDLYLNDVQMTPGVSPSYSDFVESRVQNRFTILSFDDIAGYMEKNKDIIVITDTKETDIDTYKMIAQNYPDLLNRFVVQIYHANEYGSVRKEGFKNIIYTLYEAEPDELTKDSLLKASKKPLVGFTFHKDLADDDNFLDIMKSLNTPLFVHTVNEDDEIQKYFNNGIAAIYTDRTDLKEEKKY